MANTAKSMIDLGRTQIGYREGRNNWTKYPPEVPGLAWAQNQPWCQTWISWLAVKTGNRDVIPLTASCLTCTNYYKQRGRFHRSKPQPGDLVMYGSNGGTHVDMVTEVDTKGHRVRVIGGNTGGSLNGVYYNGDGVYEKWISQSSSKIHGYARPAYKAAGPNDQTTVLPPVTTPSTGASGKWKVKRGQTITGIAALLGVSVATLLAVNPQVKDKNKISEGQELNIPSKGATKPPTTPPVKPKENEYLVEKAGETLTSIAKKLGISLTELEQANKGVGNQVPFAKGEKVNLPKKATQPPTSKPSTGGKPSEKPSKPVSEKPTTPSKPSAEKPAVVPAKYTVKRGDTLSKIAHKHGVSLSALLAANSFKNPNLIYPGQVVKVPAKGSTNTEKCTCNKVSPHQPKPHKPVAPPVQKPSVEKPPVTSGVVTLESLIKQKPQGVQRGWDRPLTAAEIGNARVIYQQAVVNFGKADGPRAAVIGIATTYQESRLINVQGGDRDSAGLFQQRPSMGWGSHAQVTDPVYASNKFFTTLAKVAPGWKSMSLVDASHAVQKSGSPALPGQYELSTAKLVVQLATGQGKHAKSYDPRKDIPKAEKPKVVEDEKQDTVQQSSKWVPPVAAPAGTPFGKAGSMWSSGRHTGLDFPAAQGTPVVAANAGKVAEAGWAGAYGMTVVIDHGAGIKTRYAHLSATNVGVGQPVVAGASIGAVGSTGNSTGPHLHFEVIANGVQVDPARFIG